MKVQVATEPMTVGQLEARLRRLVPRLGSRDKQTVLLAIEAIQDLSNRLHREQQKNTQTTVRFDEPIPRIPHAEETTRQIIAERLKENEVAQLQHRVDGGELLSDRENNRLHESYHAWTRHKRDANEPHTWDAFVAALRALYKDTATLSR